MGRRVLHILAAALLMLAGVAYYGCGRAGESIGDEPFDFDLSDPKLLERLGDDDGYALAVFYGGDVHGSLEHCGCASRPMGGLAWRVSYLKAFRQRSNGEVPSLFLDAGNFFTDERFVAGKFSGWVETKNRWVAKAGSQFQFDAANISHFDLPYIAQLLNKEGLDQRKADLSFIGKLVSANVRPLSPAIESPQPYLIREIKLKRGKPERTIRIAIVGFTELKPAGPGNSIQDFAGFRIDDPFESARRVIPELKQKADLVIALAYMPQDRAQRLATENPDIDAIIAARDIHSMEELQQFNRTSIVYAYNQTKFLGELRFYLGEDGLLAKRMNRYVGLDNAIPEDEKAAQITAEAHGEITQQQSAEQPAQPGLSIENLLPKKPE